jgi:hypothetical protein
MPKHQSKNVHAVALGKLGGQVGGPARAAALTKLQRSAIARKGALAANRVKSTGTKRIGKTAKQAGGKVQRFQ